IQLALYSHLLEQGLMSLEKGDVVAANYFVVKDSDRRKGFHLKDAVTELFDPNRKHWNFITAEDKSELFGRLRSEIQAAIEAIVRGELNPKPAGEEECSKCSWRSLCRAPHLN